MNKTILKAAITDAFWAGWKTSAKTAYEAMKDDKLKWSLLDQKAGIALTQTLDDLVERYG